MTGFFERWAVRIIIAIVVIAVIVLQSRQIDSLNSDLQAAGQVTENLRAELEAAVRNQRTVTTYTDNVAGIHAVGETIIKKVPVYVTQEAVNRCPVPAGLIGVHNAAAENVSDVQGAGDPDAPAEGIGLDRVAETVAANYTICHENAEQLKSLQTWARDVEDLSK